MSSAMITSPVTSSNRARKKKHKNKGSAQSNGSDLADQWKSSAQQEAYSSKLLHALSQVRLGVGSTPSQPRAVREAADRALAFTARGRTRWSRAILSARLRLKFMKKKKRVVAKQPRLPGSARARKPRVEILRLKSRSNNSNNNNNNSLPAVQRKVRVLGRLVPGCRKEALPVILEEATDYIAALQMQVRAMTALAELLSGSSAQSQLVEHGSTG